MVSGLVSRRGHLPQYDIRRMFQAVSARRASDRLLSLSISAD